MKNKVLIFGSNGGLGQAFLETYKDAQILALDRSRVDIANAEAVMDAVGKFKPQLVINCAAYTAVDNAETDRVLAETVNGSAVGNIAMACKVVDATLVHFSTGMVFDGQNEKGYNEDDPPNPINVYGQSKLLGEMELQKNMDSFYIVRSAWLFGKPKAGKKSFIEIMLELAGKNEVIKAVEDEFGSPTYDLDLAQAARALVEEKKAFGIYHLTSQGRASRFDWAREIFRIKNINAKLVSVASSEFPKRPAPRLKYELLNNTKFIQLRPWQEALEEFLK